MTGRKQYEIFSDLFPWLIPEVFKYQTNRKTKGIDILLKDGKNLCFICSKTGWTLTGGMGI